MARADPILVALLFLINTATAKRDYDAPVYDVCMNSWEPIVTCENDVAVGLDALEVDKIAESLGWVFLGKGEKPTNGSTRYYRFKCLSLEEVEQDLADPEGNCHLGASLTVSKARIKAGMTFTSPLYRGNIAVLTKARYTRGNGWGFTRPVTTAVWATVLLTGLVLVPFLLLIFEYISDQKKLPQSWRELSAGMSAAVWKSMTTLLGISGESIRSAEAKVIMIGYAFLVLIIVTVYTANMTSNLTVRKISATVNSPADLSGAAVGTLAVYQPRLERYGIPNIVVMDANTTTMVDSLNTLESGGTEALAMSSQWIAAVLQKRGCHDRLYMFDLKVEPFDYALPLPDTVPSDILRTINKAIMELTDGAELQRIADLFGSRNECKEGRNESPLFVFGLWQVYGVWVLMGGCIFLASMISITRCMLKRHQVYSVRMPTFVRFEGEGGEVEMVRRVAAPSSQSSKVQGQSDGVECAILLKEMRELRQQLELSQQTDQTAQEKAEPPAPSSDPADISVTVPEHPAPSNLPAEIAVTVS
ncbi:hypothetical protein BSKO_12930 [Bryopsis sp. KO-2023]|nr:hypothetical protein BSKO_12930 [Bryopsis sp. KO-2023]